MAEQQMIALAQVKINGVGNYAGLLSLEISTEGNRHANMTVTLRLETDEAGTTGKDWSGSQIQAETNEGKCLFTGECIYSRSNEMALYEEITLYVVSVSYQADIVRNSRTLQNGSKTMAGVAEEILKDYGAVIIIDEDMSIPKILVQNQETDWEFLVRTANQYGYQVYTDPTRETMCVNLGSAGSSVSQFWNGALLSNETVHLQESRLKAANQGEQAGNYHYTSEDLLTYNPFGAAGKKADGKVITSSRITSDRGVLVNYVSSAMAEDLMTDSGSMMAGSSGSHVLSGTVLSVNEITMKVQFDIDSEQNEAEAMELPYENTISNSFYCMPEEGDKVYGYIDNQGTAIILGCKRKDTADGFYDKPDEKSITALDNMIHFTADYLELAANREQADSNEDSRISVRLDSEQGVDIHGSGQIIVYSEKQIGVMAGTAPADQEKLLTRFKESAKAGGDQYIEDGGSVLTKDAWYEEAGKQAGKSFVDFFKAITAYEIRRDIGKLLNEEEFETESESFAEGTICLDGERIMLKVGKSVLLMGAGEGEEVSSIYLNADLFQWLGFQKVSGYEKMEQAYSDGFTTALDVISIGLDILGVVAMCLCPVAAPFIFGASALLSLTRGDYCGALLSVIPVAAEAKVTEKMLASAPKALTAVQKLGVACVDIGRASGVMGGVNQLYTVGKGLITGELSFKDIGMLALMVLDIIANQKAYKYMKTHGANAGDSPDGSAHRGGGDAPELPGDTDGGTHRPDADGPDSHNSSDIDAETNQNHKTGADPVDVVTGALTEQHTDLRGLPRCADLPFYPEKHRKNAGKPLDVPV